MLSTVNKQTKQNKSTLSPLAALWGKVDRVGRRWRVTQGQGVCCSLGLCCQAQLRGSGRRGAGLGGWELEPMGRAGGRMSGLRDRGGSVAVTIRQLIISKRGLCHWAGLPSTQLA